MPDYSGSPYRIHSDDQNDIIAESNRVFSLLSDRLDKIEGIRGEPQVYASARFSSDVIVLDSLRGVVLRDKADPPQYWRVTVNTAGTLVITKIGASI